MPHAHGVRSGLREDVVPFDPARSRAWIGGVSQRHLVRDALDDGQEQLDVLIDELHPQIVGVDRRHHAASHLEPLPTSTHAGDDATKRERLTAGPGGEGLDEAEPQEPIAKDRGVAKRPSAQQVRFDDLQIALDDRGVVAIRVHGGPCEHVIEEPRVDRRQPVPKDRLRREDPAEHTDAREHRAPLGRELLHAPDQLPALLAVQTFDAERQKIVCEERKAREACEQSQRGHTIEQRCVRRHAIEVLLGVGPESLHRREEDVLARELHAREVDAREDLKDLRRAIDGETLDRNRAHAPRP